MNIGNENLRCCLEYNAYRNIIKADSKWETGVLSVLRKGKGLKKGFRAKKKKRSKRACIY